MRPAGAIALLFATLVASTSRADEPPTAVRIPILTAEGGRAVERHEIDAVEQGLGAPALRGAELARALLAAGSPSSRAGAGQIAERFTAAQDLFFSGDHGAAKTVLEQIVGEIEGDACAGLLAPELESIAFRARLYLVVIARGDDDRERVDRGLAEAARRYPGMRPEPVEFPPWLCEGYAKTAPVVVDGSEAGPTAVESCELELGDPRVTLRLGGSDLGIDVEADDGNDVLVSRVAAIARGGGWPRAVLAVARPDGLEVLLIDTDSERIARGGPPLWEPPAELVENRSAEAWTDTSTDRAWYRNGLAWAVTGVGLAAAGAGFALGRVYGTPSEQEPIAWSLMAAGGVAAATGVVLFFVPAPGTDGTEGVAAGVSGAVRF